MKFALATAGWALGWALFIFSFVVVLREAARVYETRGWGGHSGPRWTGGRCSSWPRSSLGCSCWTRSPHDAVRSGAPCEPVRV